MFRVGNTDFLAADDIVDGLKVSRETAYRILHSPKAVTAEIGKKLLITSENFDKLFEAKIKI